MADSTTTSVYEVNTQSAIDNVNRLSKAYIDNNQALGGMINAFGVAKAKGDSVYSTFTQITSSGQKITTTVREVNGEFSVLSVKVAAATLANKRLAEQQLAVANAAKRAAGEQITVTPGNAAELSARFQVPIGPRLGEAVGKANELNATLARGNAILQLFNDSGNRVQIAPNLNRAKVAAQQVNQSFQDLEKTLDQISKIALATVIYRGLSLIQQGLASSISTASEYYRQLALVQTLADKNGDSFNTWAAGIEKVSNELGLPVTKVATAAYDGLSNQVIKSTKDFELLRQSFILAKTTGSDAGDSLNLLSSIINGYSKSASEAEDISDKLFTTVDLGNVKLQELTQTIGRSASLSKTLGVTFEELAAGVAVITQTGVGAAEATTLLNNVFVQLLKPNEKLKEALLDMGFQTGQAAIETLRFSGVLDELSKRSKDTADGLATFFPEIRGLRGVAALSGVELIKFNKTLVSIENSSGRAAEALKTVSENAGQRFDDELQRVKNFFTADIGTGFLKGLIEVTDKFGGISTIVKGLTIQVGLATASVGAFVVTSKTLTLASTLFEVTQGLTGVARVTGGTKLLLDQAAISAKNFAASFGGFLTFATIGYVAVDNLYNLIETRNREATQKIIDESSRAASSRTSSEKAANDQILRAFDKNLADRNVVFGRYLREQVKLSTKALEEIQTRTEKVGEGLRNSLDISLTIARQSITATEQEEARAVGAIRRIKEEQIKGQDEAEKDAFEASINRVRRQRDNAIAANQNETQANSQLGKSLGDIITYRNRLLATKRDKAIDEGDIELASRFQKEILANIRVFQEESVTARGITRYLFDQNAVAIILNNTAQDYNAKLTNRIPLLKQEAALSNANSLEQKKKVKDAEDLFRTISKFNTTVVKNGEFSPKFQEDPLKAIDQLKKLQDEALKFATTTKGIKDESILRDLGTNLTDIVSQFNAQRTNLAEIINETQRSLALNKAGRNRTELLEAEKKLVRDLGAELNNYTEILNKNAAAAAAGAELIKRALSNGPPQDIASDSAKQATAVIPDVGRLKTLLEDPKKNLQEIDTLLASIKANIGTFGLNQQTNSIFDPTRYQTVKQSLAEIDVLLANIKVLTQDNTAGKLSDLLIQSAKTGKDDLQSQVALYNQLVTLKSSLANSSDPVLPKVDEAISKVQALIQALQQVRAAEQGINTFSPSAGKAETHAGGGIAGSQGGFLFDFLSGRFKKGTDIIPAMLSRNERVISAPIAQKYATVLDAINANRFPIYRAQGSPNSAASIGTININMPTGTTNSQVRELAKQINRGIKQGTIQI